jgi:hypothetical protein
MIIHLNYTFSVPNNQLYTLYKGTTVTPRIVQASSVSSHGQTAFTHCAPCLCFVRRPFTRLLWPRVRAPSRRSQGRPLAPSASNRPMTLPRSQGAPESPHTDRLQPRARAHPSRGAFWPLHTFGTEGHPSTPSAPKASAIRDRRGGCSCETTPTKLKQHQRYR